VPDCKEILGASTSWTPKDLSKPVMGFYGVEILHRTTSKNMGIFHNNVRHNSDLVCVCVYIQGVSGGIVNILVGGSMDYSEKISSYKHVSNL